jgi:superfamily I DNA and/or RNA helicase
VYFKTLFLSLIDMLSNEYTHKKMLSALLDIENSPHRLVNELFLPDDNSVYNEKSTIGTLKAFNEKLNSSQLSAVECSLNAHSFSIIHGPPGTGKTSTVAELILHEVARGSKCLVCAPSNVAVDNILERVAVASSTVSSSCRHRGMRLPTLVRLGHPARISPHTLKHCLDALIFTNEVCKMLNMIDVNLITD